MPEPNATTALDSEVERPPPDDAWIAAHYDRVHRTAWLMTGEATVADDLTQETFVIAIEKWRSFRHDSESSTWLHGILLKLAARRRRGLARLARRLRQYAFWHPSSITTPDAESELASRQWAMGVWKVVAGLPEQQRSAVTLRYAQEMTFEQIGRTLGCPAGTAKTRVHHGLRKLRETDPGLFDWHPGTLLQKTHQNTTSTHRELRTPLPIGDAR